MGKEYTSFKTYMELNGITLEDLSAITGKSINVIKNRLDGIRGDFSLSDAVKICRHYNISADFFCGNDEPDSYKLEEALEKIKWVNINGKFFVNPKYEEDFLYSHPLHYREVAATKTELEAAPGQEISL